MGIEVYGTFGLAFLVFLMSVVSPIRRGSIRVGRDQRAKITRMEDPRRFWEHIAVWFAVTMVIA